MRIDILTLFPDMCGAYLGESIIGRAIKAEKLTVQCHNIRDYTLNKQKQVDDAPYGGGQGMILNAQPIYDCFMAVCALTSARPHLVYMSPAGKPLNQSKVIESKPQSVYVKVFGGLVKHLLPVALDPDGYLLRTVNRLYCLSDCAEHYEVDGAALSTGVLLNNQYMGTGYNQSIRLLGDFGSTLYVTKKEK